MHSNTGSQLLCVHAALAMVVLMGVALLMAGWVPPPSPAQTAAETALMYQSGANGIRFSALLMMLGGTMYWPFSVAIADQMKRIEGAGHHPLADVQLACATGTVLAILLAGLLWLVAAFRPERAPELVQVVNDLSWMMFIGLVPPALIQILAVAACVFSARESRQVLPRWYGFFNLWVATGFMAGEFVGFYKLGPFAWNGIIAFWVAATAFFGWILVTWWVMFQAIRSQGSINRELMP